MADRMRCHRKTSKWSKKDISASRFLPLLFIVSISFLPESLLMGLKKTKISILLKYRALRAKKDRAGTTARDDQHAGDQQKRLQGLGHDFCLHDGKLLGHLTGYLHKGRCHGVFLISDRWKPAVATVANAFYEG